MKTRTHGRSMYDDPTNPENTPEIFRSLRDKPVTIVAFGDSLTAQNHWTYGHLNWVGFLAMGLGHVFPKGVTMINSGVGGNHVHHGLERLEQDVLTHNPDIVIICFGMNDCLHTTPDLFQEKLSSMVKTIQQKTSAHIVLRTPNPMVDMFSGKELSAFPDGEGGTRPVDLSSFAQAIRNVALQENTQLIDHYKKWLLSMESSCVRDMILIMMTRQRA